MSPDPLAPVVVAADDAPAYWNRGALWTVLLAADQTRGEITLIEQLMPQGSGPPLHVHERAAEGFYVIEGQIDVTVGADTEKAGAGAAVWIPAGTPHRFEVVSTTARLLNLYSPGGFDDRLRYLATPAGERTLPPDGFRDQSAAGAQDAYRDRLRDLHEETPVGEWIEPGAPR